MKLLKIPHRLADYLCPINGLCDIYEWKTGNRIPDDLLFFSKAGLGLISQKRAIPPKMIFLGQCSIGKKEYNYWKDMIGYEIIANEGKTFKTTLKEIQALVDQEIPVADLRLAWANDYIGISKRNAYFGIDMKAPNHDISHILKQGISRNADLYLNAPLGFIGQRGIDRLIKELPSWEKTFSQQELKNIYLHFVEYSGSTLPEIPSELSGHDSGIDNSHRGSRDKLAAALLKYRSAFGTPEWEKAAYHFQESGALIESIVSGFIADIQHQTFGNADRYIPLFEKLKETEAEAFQLLLPYARASHR